MGWFNGRPYAKHQTEDFYIWYEPAFGNWTISVVLGIAGAAYWNLLTDFIGVYSPMGTATGDATVAKGVFP